MKRGHSSGPFLVQRVIHFSLALHAFGQRMLHRLPCPDQQHELAQHNGQLRYNLLLATLDGSTCFDIRPDGQNNAKHNAHKQKQRLLCKYSQPGAARHSCKAACKRCSGSKLRLLDRPAVLLQYKQLHMIAAQRYLQRLK
ncbi:hypothetical protein D3C78_875350 [compost metagenome]